MQMFRNMIILCSFVRMVMNFYNRITRQCSKTCVFCFGALLDDSEHGIQRLVIQGPLCLVKTTLPAPNLVTSTHNDLNYFAG